MLTAVAGLAVLAGTTTAALAERPEPTVRTLVQRPDLRPVRVTAKKTFNFGGGDTIAEGTELVVVEVKRDSVLLDTGRFLFEAAIEDTDLLERAAEIIGSLSDEALELTYRTLPDHRDIWPTHVVMTAPISFSDGRTIGTGERVALRDVQGERVFLHSAAGDFFFDTDADATDVIARARAMLSEPAADRRPWFSRSIEAALAAGAEEPAPVLADADFILVFRGSSACARCARFQPKLRKAYDKLRRTYDNFEVVYVPDEPSARAARAYADKQRMPWLVVDPAQSMAAANTRNMPGRMLPIVHLVKPDGTIVDSVAPNGRGRSAEDVVDRLERELRSAR